MNDIWEAVARRPFDSGNADLHAPDHGGVYFLYESGQLTYIGMSTQGVRDRLRDHLRGYEGSCTQNAEFFGLKACLFPTTSEAELLGDYRRKYGYLPQCTNRI